MTSTPPVAEGGGFRRRLLARSAPLFGTFIKTPGPQAIEIMGGLRFDFVVIDAEHAPFDRGRMEIALLAARASGVPALVRVASASPECLVAALDDGATGVLVPHISSAAQAREVVAACRYAGRRGFSTGTRAGEYGSRGTWQHVDAADAATCVLAMIEDQHGVEEIDGILAVEGLDGVFVGRADLALAIQDRDFDAPRVAAATRTVLAAAQRVGKPACLLAASPSEAEALRWDGASAFVIASDQGFMRAGASAALMQYEQQLRPE